jgi:hypothetical protein
MRDELLKDLQALRTEFEVQTSHPSDVASGSGEALDQSRSHGIFHIREHNWDACGRLLRGSRRVAVMGIDDIDATLQQLMRRGGQGGKFSLREAHANDKVLLFTVA